LDPAIFTLDARLLRRLIIELPENIIFTCFAILLINRGLLIYFSSFLLISDLLIRDTPCIGSPSGYIWIGIFGFLEVVEAVLLSWLFLAPSSAETERRIA
jgi:hypothetical protein